MGTNNYKGVLCGGTPRARAELPRTTLPPAWVNRASGEAGLLRCLVQGDDAELLHHPEGVALVSVLGDLAPGEAADGDARDLDAPPSGWYAHEVPGMGAGRRSPISDLITLSYPVLYGDAGVRESPPWHRRVLFYAFGPMKGLRTGKDRAARSQGRRVHRRGPGFLPLTISPATLRNTTLFSSADTGCSFRPSQATNAPYPANEEHRIPRMRELCLLCSPNIVKPRTGEVRRMRLM